jgi:GH24 family phage-related lysozyme (muramidase)
MATVETYGQRRQTLRPEVTGKMDSRATPEAFGADIGRGMQSLAVGVAQAGEAFAAVKDMEDKALVDQRVNQFSDYTRERTYNPETGYLTQQGENAVVGREAFETDIETRRTAIGEGLTPNQQRLYNDATTARRTQAYDTAIRHAAAQRKVWFDSASTARLDTFANDAMAMSDEPEKLAINLAAGRQEIAQQAAVNGWSQEQTTAAQLEFVSGVNKNIVLKHAIADPLKAKAWLDTHRDSMTQEHQYQLDNALDAPVLAASAQVEAERILAGDTASRPPRAAAQPEWKVRNSSVDVQNLNPDTATAFGRLQDILGTTLTVNDGFRTPTANEAAGGAEHSRHLHGDALDISTVGMTETEKLALINAAYDAGFTGIGVGSNIIHIDQGTPRSWGYATSSGGAPVPAWAAPTVNARQGQLTSGAPAAGTPAAALNTTTGGVDSAVAMLRGFEGMQTSAYYDVNAHRVGYGSDTWTDEQGRVHRTTADTVVDEAGAERDLARRAASTNLKLQNEFGADRWLKLAPAVRGALISVDYNYGSMPASVKDAVRTGDVNAIAASVEALGAHNGGVNAGRRAEEAAAIRSGNLPAGVQIAGGNTFVGPQYIADQVAGIADPRLRAATAASLSNMYSMQDAADRRAERSSKLEAEKFIIQNPGTDPTKLPLNLQMALGIDGMNTLWAYNDQIAQNGKVNTDEVLFADLTRLQAQDPMAFATDIDLFDYIDRLSTTDRRTLQQLQANAIKDQREGSEKALGEAKSVSTAMSIADTRLVQTGIKKTGNDANDTSRQQEARFQRALIERMREFQTQNDGRVPTDYEVSDMVDQLLLPIIMKSPGWFGDDVQKGFMFEAPFRRDNQSVQIDVPYDQIPVDVRLAIKAELATELGREPTEDEVKADYVEFVLGG